VLAELYPDHARGALTDQLLWRVRVDESFSERIVEVRVCTTRYGHQGSGDMPVDLAFRRSALAAGYARSALIMLRPWFESKARLDIPPDRERVDAVPSEALPGVTSLSAHCLAIYGLTACPYAEPAFGAVEFRVSSARMPHAVLFELGLADSGSTANTILGSLRLV
jgi:hypothetical protein